MTCEFCKGSFLAVQVSARFCSKSCRNAQQRKDRPEIHRKAIKRWTDKNPERVAEVRIEWLRKKRARLRREFWEAQGGKCYLCGDNLPLDGDVPPFIEHDHICCGPKRLGCPICRRGICCSPCNRLIGLAHDDPNRLRCIADNLEHAKELVRERMADAQGVLFLAD